LLLVKVYGKAGQCDEALSALAAAREAMEQTGERTYEAEMHRLEGELTLDRSQRTGRKRQVATAAAAAAEAGFHQAIDVARRRGANAVGLGAVMSLSRLWQQQRKRQQAHRLLAEIYGSFTEGFDTPDLRDAQTLLAELA